MRTKFVCQQCESRYPTIYGRCPNCGSWNSIAETVKADHAALDARRPGSAVRRGDYERRRIVRREEFDYEYHGRIVHGVRTTLDCGHTSEGPLSACPPTRQRESCYQCWDEEAKRPPPGWHMVGAGAWEPDDDRLPSQVTDDYWIHARRLRGAYPGSTKRCGKWLLFIPQEYIDAAWSTIKQATEEGRLGSSAKVATACPNPHQTNPRSKAICVYTYDGDDRDDVGRVLRELRALGFRGRLFWKADATTLAGLYSGEGRRVSRYSSADFE